MSEWGTVMDRLLVHARTALGIPAGDPRAERALRPLRSLRSQEWPHAFVHSPSESVALLDHLQEQASVDFQVAFATQDGDQEALATKLDAFSAAIRGDRTLSGSVAWAYVSARGIRENEETELKIGDATVTTVEEV